MAGLEWLEKEIMKQTDVEQKNHSLLLNNQQPLTSSSPPLYPTAIQTFAPLYPPSLPPSAASSTTS
jgi:hypothetical protein